MGVLLPLAYPVARLPVAPPATTSARLAVEQGVLPEKALRQTNAELLEDWQKEMRQDEAAPPGSMNLSKIVTSHAAAVRLSNRNYIEEVLTRCQKPKARDRDHLRGSCTSSSRMSPANVCDDCGEYYLSEPTTADLLARAEAAVTKGAEVEILRYAA